MIGTSFLNAVAVDDVVVERGQPLGELKRACDDSIRDGKTAHAQTPFSRFWLELRQEVLALGGGELLPQIADEQQLVYRGWEQERRYVQDDALPSLVEYLQQRINTFGLHPTLQMMRCEPGLLPPHRHLCDRLRWLADLAALLQALDNDIIGYQRDIESDFPMNIVPVMALEFRVDLSTAYLMSLDLIEMVKPIFDALVEDVSANPGEFPEAAAQARTISIWPDAFHTYHETSRRYQRSAPAADATLPPDQSWQLGPLLRALGERDPQGGASSCPFARWLPLPLSSLASAALASPAAPASPAAALPTTVPESPVAAPAPPEAPPERAPPPDFPAAIPIRWEPYRNWAGTVEVDGVYVCEPRDTADVVILTNWAREQGFRLRASGGAHNFSPLTVTHRSDASRIVLVDLRRNLNGLGMASTDPAAVRAGAGATLEALLTYLEGQGYGLATTPVNGDFTIGGIIATGVHGSTVAVPGQISPIGHNHGILSNLVVSFTAIVWDAAAGQYVARTFERAHPDSAAFLVHLGRALLTEVTLRVGANQLLRCQSDVTTPASELFGSPAIPSPQRFAALLQRTGRVEVIWYPYHDRTWVKTWTPASGPSAARPVTTPYNYPFNDHLPEPISAQITQLMNGSPELAPALSALLYQNVVQGLVAMGAMDLVGWSRNVLLTQRTSALRATNNGYAICTRRTDLQRVVHELAAFYRQLLEAHQQEGRYPVNVNLWLRANSLDGATGLELREAPPPALSAIAPPEGQSDFDVAIWLGVLTLPGTPGANRFYREFEEFLFSRFQPPYALVRPEWSKGWAYTDDGPCLHEGLLRGAIPASFGASFGFARARLSAYDPHGVFSNDFLDRLLPTDGGRR